MRGSPCAPLALFQADRMIGRPVFLRERKFEQAIMVLYRTEYMVGGT